MPAAQSQLWPADVQRKRFVRHQRCCIHPTMHLVWIGSRHTHSGGSTVSCIHVTARLMAHITCEAAADAWCQIWVSRRFKTRVCGVASMDGCSHPLLPLYGQQAQRRFALLWVQPCMTTDLYICACGKQQPVAMVARVADAKARMKVTLGGGSDLIVPLGDLTTAALLAAPTSRPAGFCPI